MIDEGEARVCNFLSPECFGNAPSGTVIRLARAAPTPDKHLHKLRAMLKKGTLASPATALARRVLPAFASSIPAISAKVTWISLSAKSWLCCVQ